LGKGRHFWVWKASWKRQQLTWMESCGGRHSRAREQLRQRPGGEYLQDISRDLKCGAVGEAGVRAAGDALPTLSGHQSSCQQPRWAFVPAKYNFTTHTPPVPAAQHRPTVWEMLPLPPTSPPPHPRAGTGSMALGVVISRVTVYVPTGCQAL
jgi:hypothetical protein